MAWGAAHPLATVLFGKWFPLEVRGGPPPPGPVVIAANHFSHLDPVIVGIALDRRVRFLAVDELFGRSRFFDRLTLWLGAIPMTRTRVPFGPLKAAMAELTTGGSVGVFPEGIRVWWWGERSPKRGAAWLARRAGVPLVPVAISGSDLAMGRGTNRISRAPMRVEVCAAIDPADFTHEADPLSAMSAEWARRIGEALADA